MEWFRCGKQATIFGLPISLAILICAFINIYPISDALTLINTGKPRLVFQSLACLESRTYDTPRMICLIKMLTGVLWGCLNIASITFFRRSILAAYLMLGMACSFILELAFAMMYALYLMLGKNYLEFRVEYRRMIGPGTVHWPYRFWLYFTLFSFTYIIFSTIALDMHWSYIKIIKRGGTGWERQAYFEIHQSEGQTVSSLQETWDTRMGISTHANGKTGESRPLIENV